MLKKIALIGANGMLATAIKKLLPDGYRIDGYDLPDFDLTNRTQVLSLAAAAHDIIINCASFTNVDGCEEQRELAMRVNGDGPGFLAELTKKTGAELFHLSTDFVFDGAKRTPYCEDDPTAPLSVYGRSKLAGEQQLLQSNLTRFFLIRTSWLYGAGGNNFVETMLRLGQERSELRVVADQQGTPTWTEDLARAIFALLECQRYGIYHFSNEGTCSWHEFAEEIFNQARAKLSLKVETVLPIPTEGYPLPAQRPKYSVLSKEKFKQTTGLSIPTWQQSLTAYLSQRF